MSPYKIIKGSDKNLSAFEEEVSSAMNEGYELANDLVIHPKGDEVLLFQAMVAEEDIDFDDEDEDEDDDEDYDD